MRKCVLLIVYVIFELTLAAQNKEQQYTELVYKAEQNIKTDSLRQALLCYLAAFEISEFPAYNLYNAACVAAQIGEHEKALELLTKRFRIDSLWYGDKLHKSPMLSSLHTMPQWSILLDSLKQRQVCIEKDYDIPLKLKLEEILNADQQIRNEYITARNTQADNLDSLSRVILKVDSLNLLRIIHLLETDGWAGQEKVGNASNVYFVILQHAPLEIQEKYLFFVKQAYENGNIPASNMAMYLDRIEVRNGREQVYGTQVVTFEGKYILAPLKDPQDVDKRRGDIGLSPIAEYLKRWNIDWNEINNK